MLRGFPEVTAAPATICTQTHRLRAPSAPSERHRQLPLDLLHPIHGDRRRRWGREDPLRAPGPARWLLGRRRPGPRRPRDLLVAVVVLRLPPRARARGRPSSPRPWRRRRRRKRRRRRRRRPGQPAMRAGTSGSSRRWGVRRSERAPGGSQPRRQLRACARRPPPFAAAAAAVLHACARRRWKGRKKKKKKGGWSLTCEQRNGARPWRAHPGVWRWPRKGARGSSVVVTLPEF